MSAGLSNLFPLSDQRPAAATFLDDVRRGLSAADKFLDCKYFYDAPGCALFEAILDAPEYYVGRAEREVLALHEGRIRSSFPAKVCVIEYGSGASEKTRWLLSALERPAAYAPIDLAIQQLQSAAAAIARDYPEVLVAPIAADFAGVVQLPPPIASLGVPRMGFFPGTSLGNLEPPDQLALLRSAATLLGPGGRLLLGLDLKKDQTTLEAAYNDSAGVTARFNLNLLARINRELGGDFDLAAFGHEAVYVPDRSRIEMRLVSLKAQTVQVAGERFHFRDGERVHTENSYKFDRAAVEDLAARTGFAVKETWSDKLDRVALITLEAAPAGF